MNNILRVIGIYFLPVTFLLLGIWRIWVGLKTEVVTDSAGNEYLIEQNFNAILAGILCFTISAIILLFVTGKLNRKMIVMIGAISIPVAVIVIVLNFLAIKNEVESIAFKKKVRGEMILRILDLKEAQMAYKTVNGEFCDDIDKLILFVKEGKVPKPVSAGNIPPRRITSIENDSLYPGQNKAIDNNMSEMEAWRLSKIAKLLTPEQLEEMNAGLADGQKSFVDLLEFKRDTVFISVIDKYFSGNKYAERRNTIERTMEFKSDFPFNVDSLAIIPHTGDSGVKFGVATSSIVKSTGPAPTLLIWAVHPMDSLEMDSVYLGNLNKVDFNGSWQ